jgi:hypothetical protein
MPKLLRPAFALLLATLVVVLAVKDSTGKANAEVDAGVWFLDSYGIAGGACAAGDLAEAWQFDAGITDLVTDAGEGAIIQVDSADGLLICIEPGEGDGSVSFVSDGAAIWVDPACGDNDTDTVYAEDPDDACVDTTGEFEQELTVPDAGNDLSLVAVGLACTGNDDILVSISQEGGDVLEFSVMCKGDPAGISLSVTPGIVESLPARFNTAHSLIRAIVFDSVGGPVLPDTEVDILVSRCTVSSEGVDEWEEYAEAVSNDGDGFESINGRFGEPPLLNYGDLHTFANLAPAGAAAISLDHLIEVDLDDADDLPDQSEAVAIFHAEGCAPGPVTVTVRAGNIEASAEITVVGPAASLVVTVAPTSLTCGEKAEIIATAADAIGQPVSDHTVIEFVTNQGGVIGGTGLTIDHLGPISPVASAVADTFDGIARAFLITSSAHTGNYEVVVTAAYDSGFLDLVSQAPLPSAQVTVTCEPAEGSTVVAPDGPAGITPPNTGDAGLAGRPVR